jgi:ATP-binding cassette subfamily F protein 1
VSKIFHFLAQFKKMLVQKRKDQLKEFEKQEKRLKELKAGGKSTKQAEENQKYLTRKQEKNRKTLKQEEDDKPKDLLKKPKEYVVKFKFPEPQQLSPPILGLKDCSFRYENQPYLFKNLNFGIDMNSRVAILGPNGVG